jgi:hypothetical protein
MEEPLEQVEKLEEQAKRRERDNHFSLLTTVRIQTGECIIWVQNILDSGVRPLNFVILSSRSDPPALILASRFSRRMRACR